MTHIKPVIAALALIGLAACSGSKTEQPKLDYQSRSHRLIKLEVPPDLNNPTKATSTACLPVRAPSAPAIWKNAAHPPSNSLPMPKY
ncbi:lipoprotein [Neisseria meningitidis]|nr:lipoprotein [Neisseria meningitidis]CWS80392.1 lipoprotein [Neisseria meningitidis]